MRTWTTEHDILLVREVLTVNPYKEQKGSRERAKLWEEIAINLNAVQSPKFSVTLRSVRDRVNLVLIKNYKKKIADEEKASGIAVDEPSELDVALEEICEKSDASDRDQQAMSKERRDKVEKEQKEAEDMRAKALEKVGQTRKRVLADDDDTDSDSNCKPQRRGRRTGGETIAYLQEKSEKEFQIRHEELELKKQQLASQQKQQKDMAEQLVRQQEQQQTMFANFQQQQQQQLQQLTQMQTSLIHQQQQQSQAMFQLLQELAKKK